MKRLILIASCIVVCSVFGSAQNVFDRQMLKGLSSVDVHVIGPPEQVRNAFGISSYDLATQVELKLRQAGLRVIKKTDSTVPPLLTVIVNSTIPDSNDPPVYAVSIDVDLSQIGRLVPNVKVARLPERLPYVGTWHCNRVYLYGREAAQVHFKQCVLGIIDEFLNDYIAENPKQ